MQVVEQPNPQLMFATTPFMTAEEKLKLYNDFCTLMETLTTQLSEDPFYYEISPTILSERLYTYLTACCGFPEYQDLLDFHRRFLDDLPAIKSFFAFIEHNFIYNQYLEDINTAIRNVALHYRYTLLNRFFSEERTEAITQIHRLMKHYFITINCIWESIY